MQKVVFSTVLAGCVMVFGSASFAQDVATPTAPSSPAAPGAAAPAVAVPVVAQDPDKVVTCHYEQPTGSYITTKVCHTRREWKQMHQSAEDTLEHQNRSGMGQAGGL